MNLIPGLSLRVTAEEEQMGLDDSELGEWAYSFVEVARGTDELIGGQPEEVGSSRGSLRQTPLEKTA